MLTSLIIVALVLTLVLSSVDRQQNHLVKLNSELDREYKDLPKRSEQEPKTSEAFSTNLLYKTASPL